MRFYLISSELAKMQRYDSVVRFINSIACASNVHFGDNCSSTSRVFIISYSCFSHSDDVVQCFDCDRL